MRSWRRSAPDSRRGNPPDVLWEKKDDGTWRVVGDAEPPSELRLQLRRLSAGGARWLRAVRGGDGKTYRPKQ
jgi:hypothetical protein